MEDPNFALPCLIFNCFAAHCYDPIESVKSMITAAKYVQKRLGGKLQDESSKPIEEVHMRFRVLLIVEGITNQGGKRNCR